MNRTVGAGRKGVAASPRSAGIWWVQSEGVGAGVAGASEQCGPQSATSVRNRTGPAEHYPLPSASFSLPPGAAAAAEVREAKPS